MSSQATDQVVNGCPKCGKLIDVTDLTPLSKIICPHCEETIRVRTNLGHFELSKLLGEGGMSQVFLANDETLNRSVALKILHQDLTKDESLTSMFEREAKLTASVNHPNVVKVYTVGRDQGYFYIAMELVDGKSLEELIAERGAIPELEVIELAYDVTSGLRAAFKAGLIHRDIKPGNILTLEGDPVKLVDFGLALAHGGVDEVEDLWATPFYVPPEKLDGHPDDVRGDIYSLGATLFHAVAGRPPFDANTASLQELKAIKSQPISVRQVATSVKASTAKLIDRMMAFDPADRYQDYDDLLQDISRLLEVSKGKSRKRLPKPVRLAMRRYRALPIAVRIGIPAGAIGAIAIGAYTMGVVEDEGAGDSLSTDSGGGIYSGGGDGASVSERFVEGRSLLTEGRVSAAAKTFDQLLSSGDLKQPTLNWTRFNAGLCALILGNREAGMEQFRHIAKESRVEGVPDAEALSQFFGKVGRKVSDELPVMLSEADALDRGNFEAIGLLAYGLKNWQAGELDSAMVFFRTFRETTPAESHAWVEAYESVLPPYRADAELLATLPKPRRSMSVQELMTVKKQLETDFEKLKTSGGPKRVVRTRIDHTDGLIREAKELASMGASSAAGGGAGRGEIGEVSAEDLEKVRNLLEQTASLGNQYLFVEAEALWKSETFTSPGGRAMAAAEASACGRAEEFVNALTQWLDTGAYSGRVIRREGVPLDAQITAASRSQVVIDLGFGGNDVALHLLAPSWMVEAGRQALEATGRAEPSSDPAGWEQLVWFARLTGENAEAQQIAPRLSDVSQEFRGQWDIFERIESN